MAGSVRGHGRPVVERPHGARSLLYSSSRGRQKRQGYVLTVPAMLDKQRYFLNLFLIL